MRYEFDFEAKYVPMLALIGVTPKTAWVELSDTELDARFGLLRCRTPVMNIIDTQTSGPYSPLKAIGPRLSWADRGATFGTTAAGGVCVKFAHAVKILDPSGTLRHPGLTLTLRESEAFAEAVRTAAGLPHTPPA